MLFAAAGVQLMVLSLLMLYLGRLVTLFAAGVQLMLLSMLMLYLGCLVTLFAAAGV